MKQPQDQLQTILDTIPGFVCTMSAAGEVELVNRRILDDLGLTLDELKDWHLLLHEADRARVIDAWKRSLQTGQPYDVEHRLRAADGDYRWFQVRGLPLRDAQGAIVRWYMLLTDIGDRKRAEEHLREHASSERQLLERIPGMIAVNDAAGSLEYVNQRLMDFVAAPATPSEMNTWAENIHPDDLPIVAANWSRTIALKQGQDVNYRVRRSDGVYRWIHGLVEPVLDEHGEFLRWYSLLVDVSEQKNAEEALRTSQAELAHVTRVTTMGELTASIAHEVNQPLTAIVNNANACLGLLPAGADATDVREALADIVADADRASAIVARVRQWARKAPLEATLVSLTDVVIDIMALAGHEIASRRVTIRTELAEPLPAVMGDRVQLQQVLLNLMVNGMDAMSTIAEPQRVLTICARCVTCDGSSEVIVEVRDAGVGLAPDAMQRLFEAFYTTKPHGMGMGLAICRTIIEAHGGRLWAAANQESGATLSFALPVAAATELRADVPEPAGSGS